MDGNEKENKDSTYSYSYVNEEHKNPDHTWRASENTNADTNANANTQWQSQTGYQEQGGYQQQEQSGYQQQSGQQEQGAYQQQTGYQQQAGYQDQNVYGSYQAPKKERRFGRKKDHSGDRGKKKGGFAATIAKCLVIAVIFGVVAGAAFTGTNKLIGANGKDATNNTVSKTESDSTSDTNLPNTGAVPTTNTDSAVTTTDVSGIVANVMPSIVAITNMGEVTYQDWFGQTYTDESESSGSGVIISQDENNIYIATNNHVVQGSTSITVGFIDNTTATAEVKGTDSSSDLAVVSVPVSSLSSDTIAQIKVATLGDSDSLAVGQSAIAIGNALGYGQSVTTGVISALDREVTLQDETTGESITNNLIQTDAAINPGNSGGALLNTNGEVIGINSAKYASDTIEGMGFAIPISTASPVLSDLITRETVDASKSAYLGISGVDVDSTVAQTYDMPEGVYVAQVYDGSAAQTAGIQKGDIITSFDGKKITSMEYLSEQMQYYEAGAQVEIVLQRASNGSYEEQTITVTLGSKSTTNTSQDQQSQQQSPQRGATAQ